ncbi:MAG: 3'-5' exonuclease [Myxococcota bacterium]
MAEGRDILGRIAVIDVETTGLDPGAAHVIEVGAVFVAPGAEPVRRSWLVRPPGPVPAWITALTGLDAAELSAAPPLGAVEAEIAQALAGWTLVAHNAAFERSFLGALVAKATFLDSCVLTHLLYPELPSHSLDALVRWAGVGAGAQHRALGDAEDTLAVLDVALRRVVRDGRRDDVDALLERLSPATGDEARALVEVLGRLRDAAPAFPRATVRAEPCADGRLERLMTEGLAAGEPVSLEIERAGAVAAALQVALRRREAREAERAAATGSRALTTPPGARWTRTASGTVPEAAAPRPSAPGWAGRPPEPRDADAQLVLAVPRRTLRELAPASPIPLVQRRPTCRARLEALLAAPGRDDGERLARAYLSALLRRSPLLVPSGWFSSRVPSVGELLRAAGPCRCEGLACAYAPGADASAAAVLVTHELALDWLEQQVPMALLILDAERLPGAERRRSSIRLDGKRLARLAGQLPPDDALAERLTLGAEALDRALAFVAQTTPVTIDLRARVLGPWLRLRDVLTGLRKDTTSWLAQRPPDAPEAAPLAQLADELSRLAEPPPPGFETRVHPGEPPVLALEPHHPDAAVVARLPRSAVLVTGSRGGLDWAQRPTRRVGPLVHPSVELEPCVAGVGAVATHAGRLALQLAGPVNLVAEGALEPFAEALREAFPGLAVRTVPGAPPPGGACVTLVPWPHGAPPDALATLIGPVRDVRRAVLACGDRDVTVLTPAERWAEVEARLGDLRDDGGLRLEPEPSGADSGLR